MRYRLYGNTACRYIWPDSLESEGKHELDVIEVGCGRSNDGLFIQNRTRSYQLHFVRLSERGSLDSEPLTDHSGFLLLPGDRYIEDGGFEQYWINFSGAQVPELLASAGIEESMHVFALSAEARTLAIKAFDEVFESDIALVGNRCYMLGLLYKLIALSGTHDDDYAESDPIDRVKAYITRNYPDDLRLEHLAAIASMSPKYLSRRFSAVTSQTLGWFIAKTRLEAAAVMLLQTSRTVDEIARTIGYRDPLYFSKAFRKHFGLSPREWRSKYSG